MKSAWHMKMDVPDIKIFVSRRIDIDSIAVNNPLYIPIRCGAVYDKRQLNQFLGDDSGDNISQKRMSFCEFTVQYWAWKNTRADYYGLCHYRRYLSFSEKKYRTGAHGLVMQPLLDEKAMKQFGLLDVLAMRREITKYDVIMPTGTPVSKMVVPRGKAKSVRDLWEAHDGIFFNKASIDYMFELIDEMAPTYSESAREYFSGNLHIGYNCYVMRHELFERLCYLQFPIMKALESKLTGTDSLKEFSRTPAYIGEMLFGIFMYHITEREQWKTCKRQLVFFKNTVPPVNESERLRIWVEYLLDEIVWKTTLWLFPLGTKRRSTAKAVYQRIIKKNERK